MARKRTDKKKRKSGKKAQSGSPFRFGRLKMRRLDMKLVYAAYE